jgi:hypothetical protein
MNLDKKLISQKWLNQVFANIDKLESEIIYNIEHSTIDEASLNLQISKLQQHYSAISNLKKSFQNDSYFIGFIE